MMKRKPALFMTVSLCSTPLAADALGLGDIELFSSLNQPLNARIELKAWQPNELEIVKVDLGSKEQFERAGLERPATLSELDFEVIEEQDGSAYIKVTSKEPFKEPFLDFLVDVTWPQGHVLREYTLLLDPPLYGAAVSREAQRNVVQQGVTATGDAASTDDPLSSASAGVWGASRTERPRGGEQTPQGRAVNPTSTSRDTERVLTLPNDGDGPSTYGPTQAGDNLWSLAKQLQAERSVGTNQMMLALFQNNPHAFSMQNMNLLKKGVVLQIPDPAQVANVSQAQALAEIKHHHILWQEYRQSVAATTGNAPAGIVPGASKTTEGTADSDIAGAASDDRVRLLSAGAGTSGVGGTSDPEHDAQALREELSLALEDAEAKQNENVELRDRLAEAEALVQDLQRLVNLKDDTIAALQSRLADSGVVSGDASASLKSQGAAELLPAKTTTEDGLSSPGSAKTAETSAIEAGATEREVAPKDALAATERPSNQAKEMKEKVTSPADADPTATVERTATAAATEPQRASPVSGSADDARSFLQWIREAAPVDPALFGIGLGGLLMLGSGVGLWRRRRASESAIAVPSMDDYSLAAEESAHDVSTRVEEDADVAEEPVPAQDGKDVVGQLPEDEAPSRAPQPPEEEAIEEDPLEEVNVYLAYERFDQAEQLLKEALEKYPSRHEYKAKLLETYAAANKVTAFQGYAQTVREEVGEQNPIMEQVMQWWQELVPDQALFSDLTQDAPTGHEAQADETRQKAFEPYEVDAAADRAADTPQLDDTKHTTPEQEQTVDKEVDLDLGEWEVDKPAADREGTEEGTLDFDLGFETDSFNEQQGQYKERALDFALPGEADTKQGGTEEGTIDFDLGSLTGAKEVARSLLGEQDLEPSGSDGASDIDFDLDSSIEDMQARAEKLSEKEPTVDEGTIDFDLGFSSDSTTAKTEWAAVESSTRDESSRAPQAEKEPTVDEGTIDFDLGFSMDNTIAQTESSSVTSETDSESSEIVSDDQGVSGAEGMQMDDEAMSLEFEASVPPGQEVDTHDAKATAVVEGLEAIEPEEAIDHSDQLQEASEKQPDEGQPEYETTDAAEDIFERDADDRSPTNATAHSEAETGDDEALMGDKEFLEDLDELQTKLDLAQAYMEMGDTEGARSILNEVIAEGDDARKQAAQELLSKLA